LAENHVIWFPAFFQQFLFARNQLLDKLLLNLHLRMVK